MKLPITKIRKLLNHWGEIRVSYFDNGNEPYQANELLVPKGTNIVDSETLDKHFGEVEEDPSGLVKLDLSLLYGDGYNQYYACVYVFLGEVYKDELPPPFNTELGREIAKAKMTKRGG